MRLFRGHLYKKYPSLWRRNLTQDERKKLIQMGCSEQTLPSNIILVKASEIEDILTGTEEKYKALVVSSESSFAKTEKNKRGSTWAQTLRPEQHLDAVPTPTPINRNRINPKKRTFPLWYLLIKHFFIGQSSVFLSILFLSKNLLKKLR